MNTNRNKMGGVGIYLVVIAVIAVLYFALARLSPSSSSYSYSNFLWDVQNGYVSSVLIKQNSEVPTGVLSITKTDNGEELLNVSDVHEIEQLQYPVHVKRCDKRQRMDYNDSSVWYLSGDYYCNYDDDQQTGRRRWRREDDELRKKPCQADERYTKPCYI